MEKLLDYSYGAKGHLEVVKIYPDGTEEVHFSDENVITSGMGLTLLNAFQGGVAAASAIEAFQIVYFQLGTSGHAGLQVSSTGALSAALSAVDYGVIPNFELDTHNIQASATTYSAVFGVIPFAYINKLSPTRVMYKIFVGDDACNNQTLNEVGLFSKNPIGASPVESSLLCAYRFFTALTKTPNFSVLFKWTIEF